MVNSRAKGAAGEREARDALNALGFKTRRGQQFSGGPESPDVMGVRGIHIEVKRVQALNIDKAMLQSVTEAGDDVPIVMHRKNGAEWLVTMPLIVVEDFCLNWLHGLGWQIQPPRREPIA